MSCLKAIHGECAGRRFDLDEVTRVGRAPDNEIVLNDHQVSRYHAEIVRTGTRYELRDLNSKNGVRVNGERAQQRELELGDRIQIGQAGFVLEAAAQAKASRFSEIVVNFRGFGDAELVGVDVGGLPAPDGAALNELVTGLGELLDCAPDDLPEALDEMLRGAMQAVGGLGGSIVLKGIKGDPIPLIAITLNEQVELTLGESAVRTVLDDGRTVLTTAWPADGAEGQAARSRCALLAALPRREETFGLLHIERGGGPPFEPCEVALIQALARPISVAIRQALERDQVALVEGAVPEIPYLGDSEAAEEVRERIVRVARSDSSVLLLGETGTGKELTARAIHAASRRAEGPFVTIDCTAIPANLMETELFGHEAGAFTGADRLKRGKVEIAERGTLFLDEVGELAPELQPKLLRFLESREFYRVGGVRPIHTDVRVIVATNRDLQRAVEQGRFREDLMYRMNVMPLTLPPLRERTEDLPQLVEHFAPRIAAHMGKPFLGLTEEAWHLLERYPWPGNVRELRHGLERALILSDDGILRPEHFQFGPVETDGDSSISSARTRGDSTATSGTTRRRGTPPSLAEVEAEAIKRVLRYTEGNQVQAAQILKIHRNTLAKKIQEYGLDLQTSTRRRRTTTGRRKQRESA